ncbi:DNA endonuclease rbbp8 [Cichlidogyrus casuarinus]|uniref:DNA endonuclease rbbp8 n=1 Tax=Cichlidogyrus casuarinus TaxID=1844966 RepID=A0ABD2Q782_9PLAT
MSCTNRKDAVGILDRMRQNLINEINKSVSSILNSDVDLLTDLKQHCLELENENRQLNDEISHLQEINRGQEIEIYGLSMFFFIDGVNSLGHQLNSMNGQKKTSLDHKKSAIMSAIQQKLEILPSEKISEILRKRPQPDTSFSEISNVTSTELHKPQIKRTCIVAPSNSQDLFLEASQSDSEKTMTNHLSERNVFQMNSLSPPSKREITEPVKKFVNHEDLVDYETSIIISLLSESTNNDETSRKKYRHLQKHRRLIQKKLKMPTVNALLSETERPNKETQKLEDNKNRERAITLTGKSSWAPSVGQVERSKEGRRKMIGITCNECYEFYKDEDLTEEEIQKKVQQCSKHRVHHKAPPSTPDGFWDLDLSAIEPPAMSNYNPDGNRFRRRRPLEFPKQPAKSNQNI